MRCYEWRLVAIGLVMAGWSPLAAGQSNSEWNAYKLKCGIPAGTAYEDWKASGSKCNSGTTTHTTGTGSAEQLGTALGNMEADLFLKGVHNLLHPTPARPTTPLDPAQDQRAFAARQLNNSGIYLLNRRDYAGAINEFQKALLQTPNDGIIAQNLEYARRLQKESAAAAGQTSRTLGNLLGGNTSPGNLSSNPAITGTSPNVFNQVNLDPNVVDFRGMFRNSLPGTGNSYLPGANANALNAVLTGSDSSVVDMSAAKGSVDPESLKSQLDGVLANHKLISEPPDPLVVLPEARDIELLFQPPQAAQSQFPGPRRPANSPKLTNTIELEQQRQQIGAQFDAIFAQPGGLDDVLLQQLIEQTSPTPAKPAPAPPHK